MPRRTRPIRFDGDLAYIQLTKGHEAIIDAVDAHLIEKWNWSAHESHRSDGSFLCAYARRGTCLGGVKRDVFIHNQIAQPPEGMFVDHADGNGLNNRRANLRLANHYQNMRNRRMAANNTSGAKGVTWNRRCKKWQAYIKAGPKTIYLGLYSSVEEAAAAYAEGSKKYHGTFGRTE